MTKYKELCEEIQAYLDPSWIATLANASALLNQRLSDINWVGFYLWDGKELALGPFQGHPACIRIALGRGVCGTAYQKNESLLVPDVDRFPGHIVCDARSKSEIVIPLPGLGVLDVDSATLDRFSKEDQAGLEEFVQILIRHRENCQ